MAQHSSFLLKRRVNNFKESFARLLRPALIRIILSSVLFFILFFMNLSSNPVLARAIDTLKGILNTDMRLFHILSDAAAEVFRTVP